MFKKNTRKRLLAGALATVMMLTMCPSSWALADVEDGIAPLPANEEIAVPVDDSTPAADPTETPADPTPSEPEAKPAEGQDPAPAPSDGGANGGTDSTESGNSTNSTIPEGSGNISQKNDVVSNPPENEISMASPDAVPYGWNDVKTIEAEYWITNAPATDAHNVNTLTISSDMDGITSKGGIPVTKLAPPTRTNIIGYETTVFGHARVLGIRERQIMWGENRSTSGTEIDAIGYHGNYLKHFEYHDKKNDRWEKFSSSDQLVFYYLVRTDYTSMVQIDVSDWAYDDSKVDDTYRDDSEHRSVTYQVYVKNADDSYTLTDDQKFWYSKTFTVSSVLVRQTDADHYTIEDVKLDPSALGQPTKNENGEYQFSLNLSETKDRNATVKIYVTPKVQQVQLTYDKDGGEFTSSGYTVGLVYPEQRITVPEVEKKDYTFVGWFDEETGIQYETGDPMPDNDLTLTAKWVPNKYKVTWKNDDGSVVSTAEFNYKDKPKSNPKVSKPSTEQFDYKLVGWKVDGAEGTQTVDPTTIPVVKDETYIAVFEEITRKYTVTYYINGTEQYETTKKYAVGATVPVEPTPALTGRTFTGWISNDVTLGGTSFTMPAKDVTIQGFLTQNKRDYTINKHFYNEKAVEVKTENGKAKPGNEYALISELYKKDAVNQTDKDGKTYVYVPGLTTVTDKLEKLTQDVTIDLYYYLDVKGGEKPDETGNGIPDAWEYRLTFKVVNGAWNNGGNADKVAYVQFKNNKTGEAYEAEDVVVPATRIPEVGEKPNSGYHAGAWDTTPVGNAKVEKDTVFTYTYEKDSSGGSSGGHHHRKPTVTIPDDVPTGLNGDDHYAYIVGYPDGNVKPGGNITRAEVATIFFRLLTEDVRTANSTQSNSLSDVSRGQWFNHAISTLSSMGIVKGNPDGTFDPDAPITRAEFAAIAARFDDKNTNNTSNFSDIASHWAKDEIGVAANKGWINGYPDSTFRPDQYITRAEAMTLVNRVLNRLPEKSEDLLDDMIKWPDNADASVWYYLAVQEATNSHDYSDKSDADKYEKWTKLRENRDWTQLEK